MKYYLPLLLLVIPVSAQQSSSTYTYDVNGRPVAGVAISSSASPGDAQKSTTMRNVNGRNVPVETVEEKVISDSGGVRIVERLVKRFDANGNPGPPEKVRVEERKQADGSATVLTTTMRGDINGNLVLAERSTSEIRKSGDTTSTTTVIERPTVNSTFDTVVKREEVERKSSNGDLTRNATTFQRDTNGRLNETAREDVQLTKRGNTAEENAARYEATNGKLQLVQQTVTRTVESPNGEKRSEVDVFETNTAGRAEQAGAKPQLRQQQIIERTVTPNGAVETMSIRMTSPDAPNRLSSPRRVQETVCTGKCN